MFVTSQLRNKFLTKNAHRVNIFPEVLKLVDQVTLYTMACSAAKLDQSSISEINLENMFVSMAKGKDPKADGRTMTLKVAEQWLTKSNIADGKQITQADLSTALKNLGKDPIDFNDFNKLVTDLSKNKGIDLNTFKEKLSKTKI